MAQCKVKGMPERTVTKLNVDDPAHARIFYNLAIECQDDFLNDHDNDVILMMQESQREIRAGNYHAFICWEDKEPAGIIWVEVDRYNVGNVHFGLFKKYRGRFTAYRFFKMFLEFCFKTLGIRVLEAHLPTRNRRAERLMRRLGFQKYGLHKEAVLVNGKPEPHVLLWLTEKMLKEVKR